MPVALVIVFSVLTGIAFRGSKVLIALYALALGANPFVVGVLAAAYSLFPLLLAVHAGRLADRAGVRRPLLFGSIGLAVALTLPAIVPSIGGLLLAVTFAGVSHIYYHVAVHYAVGAFGDRAGAAKNFANFSLAASVAAFIGPSGTGFAIDHGGFAITTLCSRASPRYRRSCSPSRRARFRLTFRIRMTRKERARSRCSRTGRFAAC